MTPRRFVHTTNGGFRAGKVRCSCCPLGLYLTPLAYSCPLAISVIVENFDISLCTDFAREYTYVFASNYDLRGCRLGLKSDIFESARRRYKRHQLGNG